MDGTGIGASLCKKGPNIIALQEFSSANLFLTLSLSQQCFLFLLFPCLQFLFFVNSVQDWLHNLRNNCLPGNMKIGFESLLSEQRPRNGGRWKVKIHPHAGWTEYSDSVLTGQPLFFRSQILTTFVLLPVATLKEVSSSAAPYQA